MCHLKYNTSILKCFSTSLQDHPKFYIKRKKKLFIKKKFYTLTIT